MRELLIVLLQRAEDWVHGAGTSLAHRGQWLPTTSFASGLRPEQRALLGAAAEVYDLVGAAPEGRAVMRELGLDPDAAGLPSMDRLLTIDARASLAYVEGTGLPDTSARACEALDRAIHELAHGGPVTMATLARRMEIPEGTLNHKVNPNNSHHFLRPSQLLQLQQAAGAVGPLRVMATELGYGLYRTGPSLFDGDPLRVLAQMTMLSAAIFLAFYIAYKQGWVDPDVIAGRA